MYDFKSVGIVQKLGDFSLQIGRLGTSFNDSALCNILYNPETLDKKVLANIWIFGSDVSSHYGTEPGLSFRSTNLKDTEIALKDKERYSGWKYYDLESGSIEIVK